MWIQARYFYKKSDVKVSESHSVTSMNMGAASSHWDNVPPGPSACSNRVSFQSSHIILGMEKRLLNLESGLMLYKAGLSQASRAWGGGWSGTCPAVLLVGSPGVQAAERAREPAPRAEIAASASVGAAVPILTCTLQTVLHVATPDISPYNCPLIVPNMELLSNK